MTFIIFQIYLSGIVPLNKRKYELENAANDIKLTFIIFQQYLSGIIPLNKRKYEQEDATNDTKKVRILKKPSTVRSLKGLSTGF